MDEGRESEGGRYQLTHEVEFINRFVHNLYQPNILLDVCCGSGFVSMSIQRSNSHTIGLDIDMSALKKFYAQSKEVSLSQGNAIRMPFADASIDCIIAVHCFDHLDRVQFLQECNRVLCTNGLMIFEALNRNSYKWSLKKLSHIWGKRSHGHSSEKWIKIWSCCKVLHTASGCSFDVQTVYGYNWIPFTQASNSIFIKPAAFIEQALHLDRFFMISPRVLVVAKKRGFQ